MGLEVDPSSLRREERTVPWKKNTRWMNGKKSPRWDGAKRAEGGANARRLVSKRLPPLLTHP
jgi:hypothetical protein